MEERTMGLFDFVAQQFIDIIQCVCESRS